jgi:DNA anti-recombination protein RmuC
MNQQHPEESQQKEYDLMLLLDRLETLREDMDELGIRTREELDARIAELHRQLDQMA